MNAGRFVLTRLRENGPLYYRTLNKHGRHIWGRGRGAVIFYSFSEAMADAPSRLVWTPSRGNMGALWGDMVYVIFPDRHRP
jgi:hypothetical protein